MTPSQATKLLQDDLARTIGNLKGVFDASLPGLNKAIEQRVVGSYLTLSPEGLAALRSETFNRLADSLERLAKELRK